jgi:5,10-methylenetetrahydrofolate reductase
MFDALIDKLQNDKYLTLETTPSHAPNMDSILNSIEKFNLDKKIDAFSTTDNPLAKLKYSSLFSSLKLQQKFNKPTIATISMRDRNKIALQSDLLGANDFDIRAILALTGDPASISDQPHVKGVFESNSNMLLEIITSFNNGMDYSGKPFKIKPKPIKVFSVINSYAKNFKSLENKMNKKVMNGAVGLVTQPIYNLENAKKLLTTFEISKEKFNDNRANAQLILGIFPIIRLRTARFLSSYVPGIYVPQNWIDALTKASKINEKEEFEIGMQLNRNLLKDLTNLHPKIHLMIANKFDLAAQLLNI